VLARWGGEEIILLLPEVACEEALSLAERLRMLIEATPVSVNGEEISISASFGVVEQDGHTKLEDLINDADKFLYQAKQAGRNRVVAASPTREAVQGTVV
jgi:diguanylate cyclase (GGDEF)-like protein